MQPLSTVISLCFMSLCLFKESTMDLAGHGNSSFNREEYTMVAFAEDIKAVIEKEQLDSVI